MRAVVLYESLTGNTRLAAELIAVELLAAGVPTQVMGVDDPDPVAIADADLVLVGTWTDGLLIVGQRPGRAAKLKRLPSLAGKRAVVFCTYAVDSGKTLEKLSALVEHLGAEVLGGMAIHRRHLRDGARDFAGRVLETVNT